MGDIGDHAERVYIDAVAGPNDDADRGNGEDAARMRKHLLDETNFVSDGLARVPRKKKKTSSGGLSNKLCKRCATLPWTYHATRPAATNSDTIYLYDHFDPERCRLCHFFHGVKLLSGYTVGGAGLRKLSPTFSRIPSFEFDHQRLQTQIDKSVYLLLAEDSTDTEDFLRSQPGSVDIETIKRWVSQCDTDHGVACKPAPTASIEQLKVMDLVLKKVVTAPPDCRFVALSYVWGQTSAVQNDEVANLEDLPRTIEDAKTVTTMLGFRYLWIDRYVSSGSCNCAAWVSSQ